MTGDLALGPAVGHAATPAELASVHADLEALDDLVGRDPAQAAACARDIAARAALLGDHVSVALARVGEAEAVQRDGDPAGAADIVTRLLGETDATGRGAEATVRASWVLSRVFTDLGDRPTALEHALDAVAASPTTSPSACGPGSCSPSRTSSTSSGASRTPAPGTPGPRSSRSGTRSCTCGSSTTAPTASWTAGTQ